ncbi:type II toxin-antitoxin system RelE/ParE family toxin [Pseudovibrio brasiliensis]|uniref:Type II toxin-antitoxin system RelE/ParE family toxin n=1 Tax=Pseudovibrio brasiliensis TaxID=1898042 RepID=A0ABX8AQZ2_9HYPH|nr:type II toxin-antitoxin system RelE/ParE family toxin [Pseudovibrio brasiliensis]QUS55631.1 type II toxin-antitoxin system RelE/ParE family toxin [Pseudovibrio brasiliensis]
MIGPKRLQAYFFKTDSGNEPVRDWVLSLSLDDKKQIGKSILKIEMGWPIGMPYCRPMQNGLFEVRCNLESKRIARILFTIENNQMVLLHGLVKKAQKTPKQDIDLAVQRMKQIHRQLEKEANDKSK